MNKTFSNKNGFTSIYFLMILPVILMVTFAFSFNAYFIQLKTNIRSHCLSRSIQIQKEMISAEKKLFKLNAMSTELQLELLAAYVALAAASETGVGIAVIEVQIERIKTQQQALDRMQRMIINMANLAAQQNSIHLVSELIQEIQQMDSYWSFYLKNFYFLNVASWPRLAVRPMSEDIAPNYELENNYKTTQTLVFEWQHRFITQLDSQQLLDSHVEFAMSCGSYPNKEGDKWTVEIKGDKF